MAIFNVAFLNPRMRKKSGGAGVKVLLNELEIFETSLMGEENNLSPGEIDKLIDRRRKLQNSGALTATQISDQNVKIAKLQQQKEAVKFSMDENIEKINRDMKNSDVEINEVTGNSPIGFFKAKIASLEDKTEKLYSSIEKRTREGMDFSGHQGELSEAKAELESRYRSLQMLESFDGENPIKGLVAYMNTNDDGEIIGVDFLPYGSKSGYAETNGMVDGCQIFGKVNYKDQDYNHFLLGDIKFTAVDTMEQDPENPRNMIPRKLVSDTRTMSGYKVGQHGWLNIPSTLEIDGKLYNTLKVEDHFKRNSFAKGIEGNLFKRREDGGYTEYLNIDRSRADLPANMEDIRTVSEDGERVLKRRVDETVDFADSIEPEEEMPMAPMETVGPMAPETFTQKGPLQPRQGVSRATTRRTPQQPKEQASPGMLETAKRTFQGGVDYLKSRFR